MWPFRRKADEKNRTRPLKRLIVGLIIGGAIGSIVGSKVLEQQKDEEGKDKES